MSVLNRDDFFSRLNERLGNDTSDAAISFLEDMSDTYNDLENRANGSASADWEKKYNDLNNAWKEKYRHRFFSGGSSVIGNPGDSDDCGNNASSITINDLFKGGQK